MAQAVGVGVLSVVDVCLPHGTPITLGIQHLHAIGIELGGYRCVQVYLEVGAFLGSDYDDAVGCARTVDGSRGGILQHLD